MKFWKYLELGRLRPPEMICFDHLYSEYLSMKLDIKDETARKFIEDLAQKVNAQDKDPPKPDEDWQGKGLRPDPLTWDELYYFELILADAIPVEKLRTKVIRLRSDFRSIATSQEFSEYMGSKPPDLQSPPERPDPKDETSSADDAVHFDKLLREDLKDLLGRMYMKYAVLPVREKRLTDLTLFAARLCLISLIALLAIILIVFLVPLVSELGEVWTRTKDLTEVGKAFAGSSVLSSLTVFVVVVSGAMGGFVSALQRIQSPRSEGDSIYNLSLLFHGSKSIFVAPVTGAIFATVLYLMFAAGILQGTFFPTIYTPGGRDFAAMRNRGAADANSNTNKPDQTLGSQPSSNNSNRSSRSNPANVSSTNRNGNSEIASANANSSANAVNANIESGTTAPKPDPTGTPGEKSDTETAEKTVPAKRSEPENSREPTKGLNVFDFLARSGPADGKAYALLIIWCFIAGFAERFVPDTLDRLISNSKSEGKK
jgi:hypothetical protein